MSQQKYHCQTEFLKIATHCNLFCSLWILTLHFARRRGCGFLSEILFPSLQKECLLWSQTQKIWETCNRIEFQKPRTFFFFFIVYQGLLVLLLLQRYISTHTIMLNNLIWKKNHTIIMEIDYLISGWFQFFSGILYLLSST